MRSTKRRSYSRRLAWRCLSVRSLFAPTGADGYTAFTRSTRLFLWRRREETSILGNYVNQRLLAPVHVWLSSLLRTILRDVFIQLISSQPQIGGLIMFELFQCLFDRSYASSRVNTRDEPIWCRFFRKERTFSIVRGWSTPRLSLFLAITITSFIGVVCCWTVLPGWANHSIRVIGRWHSHCWWPCSPRVHSVLRWAGSYRFRNLWFRRQGMASLQSVQGESVDKGFVTAISREDSFN